MKRENQMYACENRWNMGYDCTKCVYVRPADGAITGRREGQVIECPVSVVRTFFKLEVVAAPERQALIEVIREEVQKALEKPTNPLTREEESWNYVQEHCRKTKCIDCRLDRVCKSMSSLPKFWVRVGE